MTSLNAEKYLRGLPLKNDREMPERYAALSAEMAGMAETSRRVFHICCDGLFSAHTAAMLAAALRSAGVSSGSVAFDALCEDDMHRTTVFIDGKRAPDQVFCPAVHELRAAIRAHGNASGRYEAGAALAVLSCRNSGARVLISANMLRDGGDVFLDDLTLDEASEALGVPVVPVEIDGADLLAKIFEE